MPEDRFGKGRRKRRDESREPRDYRNPLPPGTGSIRSGPGSPRHDEPEHIGSLDMSKPPVQRHRGDIGDEFDLWI